MSPGRSAAGSRFSKLFGRAGLVGLLFLLAPVAARAVTPVPLGKAASSPPELAFESHAIAASGLSPGGDVVVHGISRQRDAFLWRLVQTREVLSADATGVVRLELPDDMEVAETSVWTVVDSGTGDFTVASPGGALAAREVAFPADGLGESEAGVFRVLRSRFERMEALFVRPGEGAWWLLATNGASSDRDGRVDSALTIRLDEAETLWGDAPPPRGIRPGDVVVAVNLDTLDYFAARLVEPGADH